MSDIKYIQVKANISEVKYDKEQNRIFLALDIDGQRKTVEISQDQLIKFAVDQEMKRSIMLKYYDAWKYRKEKGLSIILELTEEQLNGEKNV